MRSLPILASSLLLLVGSGARAQESDEALRSLVKALAADDASREKALAALDARPVADLEKIHGLAAKESPEVRTAARRWVPPASWILSEEKTVGDARARLAELASLLTQKDPGDRDEFQRRTKQLLFRGGPMVVPDALRAIQAPLDHRIVMTPTLLAIHGTSDLTPALLDWLNSGEQRPAYVHNTLLTVGDSRTVQPALDRLKQDENDTMWALQMASLVGGPDLLQDLEKLRSTHPKPALLNYEMTRARLRLRDPKMAAELLALRGGPGVSDREMLGALCRLGDRSILPTLVEMAKKADAPAADKRLALYVLGILGGPEHVPLVLEQAKQGDAWFSTLGALIELDEPVDPAPFVEPWTDRINGEYAAKAVLRLKWKEPANLEGPVLDLLAAPERRLKSFAPVLEIAGRLGGPRITERLLELLMAPGDHPYDDFDVARALKPHFDPKALRRLSRSSSPDAPREDAGARSARLALRGALGDEKSRILFVNETYDRRHPGLPLRGQEFVHALLKYPGLPEEILPAVQAAFETYPDWLAGAMFLAKHGQTSGFDLIRRAMGDEKSQIWWNLMIQDLPVSLVWSLGLERIEITAGDEELLLIAQGVPAGAVPALRSEALAEAMQMAHKSPISRTGMPRRSKTPSGYQFNRGTESLALGFLAARLDPVMESFYRWVVRSRIMEEVPDFTYSMCAQALARLGHADLLDTYRRMMRSTVPGQRQLGVRCCLLLGDRRALPDLAVLLNDHEAVPRPMIRSDHERVDVRPPPRVCDAAADAIEKISGERFPGPRGQRIAAIKAWLAK